MRQFPLEAASNLPAGGAYYERGRSCGVQQTRRRPTKGDDHEGSNTECGGGAAWDAAVRGSAELEPFELRPLRFDPVGAVRLDDGVEPDRFHACDDHRSARTRTGMGRAEAPARASTRVDGS